MVQKRSREYDVFISYRWISPDKEWVREELYPALRNAGLKICVDVEDFIPGRDLILEMDRASETSRHVLCILTPEYFTDGRLVEFESLSARRRDPSGKDSFLIPLILKETTLPGTIRGLVPINWVRQEDREREWQKLLRVLGAPNLKANPPRSLQKMARPETTFDGAFIFNSVIRSEFDLDVTVENLRKKSEKEALNHYERSLIHLHDAARTRRRKEVLDISNADLMVLPREIGIFDNLVELNLEGNRLISLPASIGKLKRLKKLQLQNNRLNSLPIELSSLRNLRELLLEGNSLAEIPPEIGHLRQLQHLNLSNNKLRTLPSSMSQLTALTEIFLQGNEIPIPPEISSQSPSNTIAYVLQVSTDDARSLSEAKVLVVGQGGVGKTSLVNRLIDGSFYEFEPKTEGIRIKNWHWHVNGRWIRTNLWDFGGQEIMHATHQFFLTERSLYILVWDARQEDTYGQLDYWLNIIQSFGGDAPVIIVLNKTDVGSTEIDRRGLKHKFPNIKAFVNSSCKTGVGLADLKEHIGWHVYQLPHTTTVWPPKWFIVKSQLEQANKDYISLSEYDSLCSSAGISIEDDRRNLLQFLHDLGIVLSFHNDPRLCDTNVLNPEWATGGVYGILNDNKLFGKGVLEMEDLSRILETKRYPRSKHGFIVDIMQKFELCYQIDESDKPRFLIPDLLTKQQPFFKWDFRYSLAFQYHYNFLPSSVISRFIVRIHPFIDKDLVWHTGVILRDGKNRALVMADRAARRVLIFVDGPTMTRRDLLAKIRINFEHIHRSISKVRAAAKVPLPEDHSVVVDYKHLINLEAMGEQTLIPEGMKRKVKVSDFLFGIDKAAQRPIELELPIDEGAINSDVNSQKLKSREPPRLKVFSVTKPTHKTDQHIDKTERQVETHRLIEELSSLVAQDSILPENEKVLSLKKTKLLAEFLSETTEITPDSLEETITSIKGSIVEGSAALFESGKHLLHQIMELLKPR